jgi:hypothetical protein
MYVTDPLSDNRWDELVAVHPRASAFHQRGWLESLVRTYGYEPLVLTTTPAGSPLSDGVVLCRVSSWLTGTRLVSLPFADHCEPLLNDPGEYLELMDWVRAESHRQSWKYVELRPLSGVSGSGYGLQPTRSYCFHTLDIKPTLEQIFRGFHRDSIQRRIRRAERAGLGYEVGCSEQLMSEFYSLLLVTRRRHQLPPQPRVWFSNLLECMGDKLQIRLVRKGGAAIAALLALRHRSSVIYKYGCSDEKHHNLGGMPFLFWRLIEESKATGVEELDLGRSDLDNQGLIVFKDRFGTTKRVLTYYRCSLRETQETETTWDSPAIRLCFSLLPDPLLAVAGKILYRHMA